MDVMWLWCWRFNCLSNHVLSNAYFFGERDCSWCLSCVGQAHFARPIHYIFCSNSF